MSRYFKRELLSKKAITTESLSPYFLSWVQKGTDICIYTPQQLHWFKLEHLNGGAWYLDYSASSVPKTKAAKKSAINGIDPAAYCPW